MQGYQELSLQYLTTCIKLFRAFVYISLIIFPWIIEIILATQQNKEQNIIMMMVCGSIQTVISIHLETRLGILFIKDYTTYGCQGNRGNIWRSEWCSCPNNFNFLFASGYIIYFLPQWVVTNIIISWTQGTKDMPLYVHMMVYLPLLTFIIFLFVGLIYEKAEEEIEEVENRLSKTSYQTLDSEFKEITINS